VVGALLAFSVILNFDPTRWLCLSVMLCGIVSSSRLILRQHQLLDVGLGTLVGILCGFFCIWFA
jgi:membrane-associated phospholipid phosphatase